ELVAPARHGLRAEETVEPAPLALGVRRLARELAPHEIDGVGRDAREELQPALGRRNDLVGEEASHRGEQLVDRRPVLHQKALPSIRLRSSHSVSAVRRPMLASSTLGTMPSRKPRAWTSVKTPQRRLP